MEILSNDETITIITDDSDFFVNMSAKMRENFKSSIGTKNKTMAFYDVDEVIQRKYFFKFINKIYKKENGHKFEFNKSCDKKIKLVFQKENSLQILLHIKLKFDRNSVIFDMRKSDELFVKYLLKNFTGIPYDECLGIYNFNFESLKQVETLENIIFFREHLKFLVDFDFNHDDFKEFKKRIKITQSPLFNQRFTLLANLLSEHFETLGVSANDDFSKVRSSYLELSKIYHPDKTGEDSNTFNNEKFQKISLAYEALKPFYKEQDEFIKAC